MDLLQQLCMPAANSPYAHIKTCGDAALTDFVSDYAVFAGSDDVQLRIEDAVCVAFGGNWIMGCDFPLGAFAAEGDYDGLLSLLTEKVFADMPSVLMWLPDAPDVETATKNFWGSIEAAAAGFLAKLIEHKLATTDQWRDYTNGYAKAIACDLTAALERLQAKFELYQSANIDALEQASAPTDSDPDAQELREELDALVFDSDEYISDDELAVQKAISAFAAKKLAC